TEIRCSACVASISACKEHTSVSIWVSSSGRLFACTSMVASDIPPARKPRRPTTTPAGPVADDTVLPSNPTTLSTWPTMSRASLPLPASGNTLTVCFAFSALAMAASHCTVLLRPTCTILAWSEYSSARQPSRTDWLCSVGLTEARKPSLTVLAAKPVQPANHSLFPSLPPSHSTSSRSGRLPSGGRFALSGPSVCSPSRPPRPTNVSFQPSQASAGTSPNLPVADPAQVRAVGDAGHQVAVRLGLGLPAQRFRRAGYVEHGLRQRLAGFFAPPECQRLVE